MGMFAKILEQARGLFVPERLRLIAELEGSLGHEETEEREPSWLAAMDAFLSLGGTAHSDHADVSSDKYKHLAEIYADRHA